MSSVEQQRRDQPNRLAGETSPYLRQHAFNPVDWHPWGGEALARARAEDRPILLSIGYSACHWCHVMERESFESVQTAALMNKFFVCIKVDREERPDLDAIYMEAVQIMTGHGGWPLTVFLTPDGRPFYGGTYFPPEDRHGLPGFPRLLQAIAHHYKQNRGDVERSSRTLLEQLGKLGQATPQAAFDERILERVGRELALSFDSVHGGFGHAPKFPTPTTLGLLLRLHRRSGDAELLEMVELTLRKMAAGGLYDQLGGGFHRYSTDTYWLVPHFEKMLYDNAQLVPIYLEAFQVRPDPELARIAHETLAYVQREMTSPDGAFYSTQDADSEGVEGKFFAWSAAELRAALGPHDAELALEAFGVTEAGNFEHGKSVLSQPLPLAQLARHVGRPEGEVRERYEQIRRRLWELRETRVKPARDEKVLASWNGLMLSAFARGAAVLRQPNYRESADRAADFLLGTMRKDGRLFATYKDGSARLNGYLDDYAFVVQGLLDLYELSGEVPRLQAAIELVESALEHFVGLAGGFFFTSDDHEPLIVRTKSVLDNAVPSGNSVMTLNLLRLAAWTGEERYRATAERTLAAFARLAERSPMGFSNLLSAFDFYLAPTHEIAIVGPADHPRTQELIRAVHSSFQPHKVLALKHPGDHAAEDVPLLRGKTMLDGQPTAYVCRNFACEAPTSDPEVLRLRLHAPPAI